MKPYRKPFSKTLYSNYDSQAKTALIEYLNSLGHQLLDSVESYDADIITEYNGVQYYSEAEVKTAWRGDWPSNWREIRIPERKKKLLEKHTNLKFYIFSSDLDQCWCIDSSLLTDNILRKAFGKNIHPGELFYHVPYQEAELIDFRSSAS